MIIISWLLFFFLATWLPFRVTSNQYEGFILMWLTLIGGAIVGIILTATFLNENKNFTKWMKVILIWLIIPLLFDLISLLLFDVINLFSLSGRLPRLLLMSNFHVSTFLYSATAWIAYTAIVMGISKRKRV